MKLFSQILALMLVTSLFTTSCSKIDDLDPEKTDCTFLSEDLKVEPFCSFNPKTNTTVSFPVAVKYNGALIGHDKYYFEYSTNPDFHGTAISVTYDELPLTVTVTEIATDCVATATIDKSYWD